MIFSGYFGWMFCKRVGGPAIPPPKNCPWKVRWATSWEFYYSSPTPLTFTLWKITEVKIKIFWWLNLFQQNSLAECEDKMTNFSDAKDLQTPMSAGYLYKKTFFQSFPNKNRFKLTRSESERRLPPARFERTDSGLTGEINLYSLPFR